MSAQPDNNTIALPTRNSADDGDVASDAIALGFDHVALALIEEDEELAALEGAGDPAIGGIAALPDEDDAGALGGPSRGADAGDVPDVLEGFRTDQLDAAESDEELNALEGGVVDSRLPGEGRPLIDQPDRAPSRKVKAAGLGGLLGALPAPLLALLDTVTVSEPVLGAISAALTLVGALAAAFMARERAPEA